MLCFFSFCMEDITPDAWTPIMHQGLSTWILTVWFPCGPALSAAPAAYAEMRTLIRYFAWKWLHMLSQTHPASLTLQDGSLYGRMPDREIYTIRRYVFARHADSTANLHPHGLRQPHIIMKTSHILTLP